MKKGLLQVLISNASVDSSKPTNVGSDPGNTLMVPDAGGLGDQFEMFSPAPGGFYLNLNGLADDVGGRLKLSGEETPLKDARKARNGQIAVGGSDWGVVDFENIFRIDRVVWSPYVSGGPYNYAHFSGGCGWSNQELFTSDGTVSKTAVPEVEGLFEYELLASNTGNKGIYDFQFAPRPVR